MHLTEIKSSELVLTSILFKRALNMQAERIWSKVLISTLNRSPSQTTDLIHLIFLLSFDRHLRKLRQTFKLSKWNLDRLEILGYFNARSSSWWVNDTTFPEEIEAESQTLYYGLPQVISEPTYLLSDSSCIKRIFSNQPNFHVDCDDHPSLHLRCHDQIVYSI